MFDKLQMKIVFRMSARLRFYRMMARQTDGTKRGVKPVDVLRSMIKNEEFKGRQTALSKLYRHIRSRLELGKRMGEVLQEFVPAAESSQIYAAEMSGRISNGFVMAGAIAKQQAEFKKVFREALIGPTINLFLSIGIMYMFFNTLVPTMTGTIPLESMSPFSMVLAEIAKHFNIYLLVIVTLIIISSAWTIWALPRYNGWFRLKYEKFPPFSMYKLMVGCSFLYAYNALTKSGVAQVQALHIIRKFATPYLTLRINKILEQTSRSIGEALIQLKLDFPDKEIITEMAMASEQGVLTEALPEIVENLSIDGLELIKLQAQIAKGFAMVLVVGSVFLMLIGLFSFMADMQSMTGV